MNIEAGFLCTCNEACEMNVSAVCAASQEPPKLSAYDQWKPSGSHATCASEQRWCGVEKRRISTSGESTVVRDILTEKHRRPKKNHGKCCRNRVHQGIGSKSLLLNRFSRVTNFECKNSGQSKKNACNHPGMRAAPSNSTWQNSSPVRKRSRWRAQKIVGCLHEHQ